MVLSATGPLGLALPPRVLDAVAYASEPSREEAFAAFAETRSASRFDGLPLVRNDFGRPQPGEYGWFSGWRGDFRPPIVAQSWAADTMWIVVVVDVPSAPQMSLAINEPHQPVRPPGDGPGPNVAALAAMLGGAAQRPAPSTPIIAAQSAGVDSVAPMWFASATQDSPDAAPFSTVSASWTAADESDAARADAAPTPHNLLVPDPAADAEGGLIELEEPRDRHSVDDAVSARKRRLAVESLAALEWVWSELGSALAPLESAKLPVAESPEAAPQVATAPQAIALDGEGGMIALAVDGAAVPGGYQPTPALPRAPHDAGPLAVEAGVALFQAFELGEAPGAGDESGSLGASLSDELPQENAAADDAGEPLQHRAAIGAAAIATLPVAIRRRKAEDLRAALEARLRRLGVTRLR
jgi:hypothetical protein